MRYLCYFLPIWERKPKFTGLPAKMFGNKLFDHRTSFRKNGCIKTEERTLFEIGDIGWSCIATLIIVYCR